jgi:copper oxidase (laccase) domain-containing protein
VIGCIEPDWPAPAQVRALVTTRDGGASRGEFASFNLAAHVGDDPQALIENRRRLRVLLPAEPLMGCSAHKGVTASFLENCDRTGRPT